MAWCDTEMEKATSSRDENIGNIEGDLAEKSVAESNVAKLTEEIQQLMEEISELSKSLNEATELRNKEKAENTKALADATQGLEGTKKAMKILKDFYDNAFIQIKKTSEDQPESFSGDFSGNQGAASGIIGQLDVIKSDFEAAIDKTKSEESDAETKYDDFKSETETDLKEHTELKEDALKELDKLKPACVATGSDYEEKVARREQEIESLKNAYTIFDEMR